MRLSAYWVCYLIVISMLVSWFGCTNKSKTAMEVETLVKKSVVTKKSQWPNKQPLISKSAPLEMPQVIMSDTYRKTCRIFQNDVVPDEVLDALLTDIDGKQHTLRSLLKQRLTILAFWSGNHDYALWELSDLTPDFAEPFADKGVRVVTVNQSDTKETARKLIQEKGASTLVNLLDPNGAVLSLLATKEEAPRIYLLDVQGKILWFDIEYGRHTRRELDNAIRFVLEKESDSGQQNGSEIKTARGKKDGKSS